MAIFYVDGNLSFALNDALRANGHAVFTTRDERRLRATDDNQLLYAADRRWIVLTHNRADFILLHSAWHLWARAWSVETEHAGIVVLEPIQSPRHGEVAALIHTMCQENALANTLFAWKRTRVGNVIRVGKCDRASSESSAHIPSCRPFLRVLHAELAGWYTTASPRKRRPKHVPT